jgi:hypothetical protein
LRHQMTASSDTSPDELTRFSISTFNAMITDDPDNDLDARDLSSSLKSIGVMSTHLRGSRTPGKSLERFFPSSANSANKTLSDNGITSSK